MLETLIKLYWTYMTTGVTSPMPHFVGPPGSGKSTIFQQLADLLGVELHIVNVSRISPLGLEGLEMLRADQLKLYISELWTKGKEGDIYLFDEFLRGFPEVYNGLLDIFTSRKVAGFELPRVFIAGASNTTVAYDSALEDRLLHISVPDPRRSRGERGRLSQLIVDELGLLPEMATSLEMKSLIETEVLPTFTILDSFSNVRKEGFTREKQITGTSVRKLIGQAKLRHCQSTSLEVLISANNALALQKKKPQYVLLLQGSRVPSGYAEQADAISESPKLTPLQSKNMDLNFMLMELQEAKQEAPPAKGNVEDELIF